MKNILILLLFSQFAFGQNITLNLGGASGGGGAETDPIVRAINGIVKSDGATISAAAQTGTGSVVLHTSPLLVTPRLSATSTTSYVWTATDASGNGSFQALTGGGDVTLNGTQTLTNKTLGSNTSYNAAVDFDGQTITNYLALYNNQTGTTYTLLSSDAGKIVTLSNASAITLTVPTGLPIGFNCTIVQLGAGVVTFTASGTTINNRQSFTQTGGQYAVASIVSRSTNTFIIGGDLQ